jgi:hypothetical protein
MRSQRAARLVPAESVNLSRYKVVLVPPLYSASDKVLERLSDYVRSGGDVVLAFKSGFTDQHSTVRPVMAPGPLRTAAGFHYQEFTSLPRPRRLIPDSYGVGDQNEGSVWQEFLVLDTAEAVASFDHSYRHAPISSAQTRVSLRPSGFGTAATPRGSDCTSTSSTSPTSSSPSRMRPRMAPAFCQIARFGEGRT